jgi:hypothetical protein
MHLVSPAPGLRRPVRHHKNSDRWIGLPFILCSCEVVNEIFRKQLPVSGDGGERLSDSKDKVEA